MPVDPGNRSVGAGDCHGLAQDKRAGLLVFLVGAAATCFSTPASATGLTDYLCTNDPCDVVSQPNYVNVYWGWGDTPPDPSTVAFSPDRVDRLTFAVANSLWSQRAGQYLGNAQMSVGQSVFITSTSCPGVATPTNINGGGSLDAHNLADSLQQCLVNLTPGWTPDRTIFNLILGPFVIPQGGWCQTGGAGADHHSQNGAPMTFVPVNCTKNPSFGFLATNLTHEMIEAATRAEQPGGWWDISWGIGSDGFYGSEAADLCEGEPDGPPGELPAAPFLQSAFDSTSQISAYFSNSDNGCLAGGIDDVSIPFSQEPQVRSSSVVGTGKHMAFNLSGGAFGMMTQPSDLEQNTRTPEGGMDSVYVSAQVLKKDGTTWSVGGFWRVPIEDSVGFSQISVTNDSDPTVIDSMQITGFDGFYGQANPLAGQKISGITSQSAQFTVAPGDKIDVDLINPNSGETVVTPFTAPDATQYNPSPAAISTSDDSAHPGWIFAGDTAAVVGGLKDSNGGAIEGDKVEMKNSVGTMPSSVSDEFGVFSTALNTSKAGPQKIQVISAVPLSADVFVDIHPVATSLSDSIGTYQGNQALILAGAGYVNGHTKVIFTCQGPGSQPSADATVTGISPDGSHVNFTTPPLPCAYPNHYGTVSVVTEVYGVPSVPLSYLYVVPGQPVLSFQPGCRLANFVSANGVSVRAYTANGQAESESVQLTAPYPAFDHGTTNTITLTTHAGLAVGAPFEGNGPITATTVNPPILSVTESYPNPPIVSCVGHLPSPLLEVVEMPPGDPVEETVDLQAIVTANSGAGWELPSVGPTIGTPGYVAMFPTNMDVIGSTQVRALSLVDLTQTLVEHPMVAGATGLHLTGNAFEISQAPLADINYLDPSVSAASLSSSLIGGFQSRGSRPASVLYLGPGATDWAVAPLVVSSGSEKGAGGVAFAVDAPGIYALATEGPANIRGVTNADEP